MNLEADIPSKSTVAIPVEVIARQPNYRWVVLFLVWLAYAMFGISQRALAPLVSPILRDLGITYGQMGIILGAWQLTYIIVATIAGAVLDRWGIRKAIFGGLLIMGLSVGLRYFTGNFAALFILVALLGLGGPMTSVGCPKAIAEWFQGKDRSRAVGIYMTGPSAGGLIAYTTINSLIMPATGFSWRLTFVWLSLPIFVTAIVWAVFARERQAKGSRSKSSVLQVFTGLMRVRNVQLILIMGLFTFMVSHGFVSWLPKILENSGQSPAIAGFAASIPLVVSIPVVILVPQFTPPRWRGRVIGINSLAMAILFVAMAGATGGLFLAELVLWGVFYACNLPLLVLLLMDLPEVSVRYMGSAGGLLFCVAEVGGFSGPSVLGYIKDLSGTFVTGLIAFAAVALVLCVLALMLRVKPAGDSRQI